MPAASTRSLRERALEKIQKILSRGWRDNIHAHDTLLWDSEHAVLRSPHDLGATQSGWLLLKLGTKNTIEEVQCDDAGPAWNMDDANHDVWKHINSWAATADRDQREGRRGGTHVSDMIRATALDANLDALSNKMICQKTMAWWQWHTGLRPVLDMLFVPDMSNKEWLWKAHYLHAALKIDDRVQVVDERFTHRGTSLDTRYLTAWLVVLSIQQYQHDKALPRTHVAYPNLRLDKYKEKGVYDWFFRSGPKSIVRPYMLRVNMQEGAEIFKRIQESRIKANLSVQERTEFVALLYDIAKGHAKELTPGERLHDDCAFLVKHGRQNTIQESIGVLSAVQQWWNPKRSEEGAHLLGVLDNLCDWNATVKNQPKRALDLLLDAAQNVLNERTAGEKFYVSEEQSQGLFGVEP